MAPAKPKKISRKKRARLDQLIQHGLHQERAGNLSEATEAYQNVLKTDPSDPLACQALGNLYNRLQQFSQAEPLLRRAADHFKENAKLQCAYADCLRNLGRLEEALVFYSDAIRLNPELNQAYLNLAGTYSSMQLMDQAIATYQLALNSGANEEKAHAGLGSCYRYTGNFDQAIFHFQRVIAQNPQDCEALYWLVQLTDQAGNKSHIDILEATVESAKDSDRVLLNFALAKAYDDVGDSARSFGRLEQANKLKRKSFHYDERETTALFASIRSAHQSVTTTSEQIGIDGSGLIFIVGMPRSGTSLVEQILASHSQVFGAGELDSLNRIAAELELQTQTPYPEAIYAASSELLVEQASHYLQEIAKLSNDSPYVTDKMPQNFRHLGLIDRLFGGKAKIIHCQRDPMATCWSIYKQLFQGYHPYAYSQRELGDYYRQYESLMQYWHSSLKEKIYSVRYEQLVEDLESEVPKLLDWLGLSFEPDCLAFHKTERAVATASATQVRQPLYQHAVKGWRRYEEYLSELKSSL